MPLVLEAVPESTLVGNVIVASGAFVILIVLLKLFAWDQITAIFDARAKKISDDIDNAEKARAQAEQLASKREAELAGSKEEAAQIVANANEVGKSNQAKIVAQAHEEAKRLKAQADTEIAQAHSDALKDIKSEVADISVKIAEKIIGKSLDDQAQSEIVDAYLSKLGE
jgi:F-type H+-transporting ATPase subunit b